jgi:hypothetical protein
MLNEQRSAGSYQVKLDVSALINGVYFRLIASDFVETKNLLLLK